MLKKFLVVHPDPASREPFERRFAGLPGFQFLLGTFPNLPPIDCFVTAANSYGIMTAGIDAAVVSHFGTEIMNRVQDEIVATYRGEQPVGTAFILATGNSAIPTLCHAPTMRIPGSITGTDKVYAATWASLLAAHGYEDHRIESICFPAMGTGFGQISFDEAARQMAVAWDHYLNAPTSIGMNWDWVVERHKRIAYDGAKQMLRGC